MKNCGFFFDGRVYGDRFRNSKNLHSRRRLKFKQLSSSFSEPTMHGFLAFLSVLAVLACSWVGPCSASPIDRALQPDVPDWGHESDASPDDPGSKSSTVQATSKVGSALANPVTKDYKPSLQPDIAWEPTFINIEPIIKSKPGNFGFKFFTPSQLRLGTNSLLDKHKALFKTAGQLTTANGKGGLLEQISQLSTRQQQNAAVHKLGDKEEHSVSSAKTLDEKHFTAIADGFGGQSQNVSAVTTTEEKLSSSQFAAGIGQHVVSSQQTEDEKHTALSISAAGEEKHISSASSATDEKHSVFASGTEDIIPLKSSPAVADGSGPPPQ